MHCDVLNLEWASKGRDIDIVEPVLSFLEIKFDFKVVRESILNAEFKLLKYRPKLLVISNAVGAPENLAAVKFASKIGVKVVTLVSEGNYLDGEESVNTFFWGWNKERCLNEVLHLEWTYRNVDLIHKYIPNSNEFNIKVSGATGFDRYKIISYIGKHDFLREFNKQKYSKVVGIAAWAFDQTLSSYYDNNRIYMDSTLGGEFIDIHRKSKDKLHDIYRTLIENNPEVLFVLKFHPGMIDENLTELYELDKFENTVRIVTGKNIADVINVSDFWVTYESTTCLEAWLLKKQTMLVNPLGGDFKRANISAGSPIKTTYTEVQEALDTYYANGEIPGFRERDAARKEIIGQVLQWDDGKNHIRAAEYIYEALQNNTQKKAHINIYVIKRLAWTLIINIIYLVGLNKWQLFRRFLFGREYLKSIFDPIERDEQTQKYKSHLKRFYVDNNITL